MGQVLKRNGYEVFPAEHGPQAIELWRTHQGGFDLVLTDMVMPGGVTGRDLARTFLATNPQWSPRLIAPFLGTVEFFDRAR